MPDPPPLRQRERSLAAGARPRLLERAKAFPLHVIGVEMPAKVERIVKRAGESPGAPCLPLG